MPRKKRSADDYKKAAEDSLILAETLAGQKPMTDQEFLQRMGRSDEMVEHDGKKCGLCYNIILGAQVARDMLKAGETEDVISKWAEEARRRWQESKFFKLWQKEKAAGRDPHEAFKKRGWEP